MNHPRARRAIIASLAAMASVVLASPAPAAARAVEGSRGVGDPYFPSAGNGGYDVESYELEMDYVPATRALTALAAADGPTRDLMAAYDSQVTTRDPSLGDQANAHRRA